MSKANLLKAEKLVRQTDNDVMTYLKVLEGSRVKPKGMILPSQSIINDISDNILTGVEDPSAPGQAFRKKGFRFSPGTLREYKFSIIDSLLGAKQGTYKSGREKFVTKGKELDEIFSLSATAKRAPGYAEAIQSISKTANKAKIKQIDLPFQRILNALDEGKTTMQWKDKKVSIADAAKDFNKTSLKFANKYKIRSPKINIGGNFNKKLFENYGELSKKNIADTFKNKNYYLTEVKNRPVGTIAEGLPNFWCGTRKAYGGRVSFASGSGCPDSVKRRNFLMLNNDVRAGRITGEAAEQIAKNTAKVVAKAGGKSAFASLLGPTGIGLDIVYEVGSIGFDMAMDSNVSFKQALQNNWVTGAFIPGTGQEEYNKGLVKFDSKLKVKKKI